MPTAVPVSRGPEESPLERWRGPMTVLFGVAVAAGIGIRLYSPSPLWLDEALSVRIAGLDFDAMVDALRNDGHPSLYYLLLGWWMDLFGDSNAVARSLSVVVSLLTVPVLWAIGRRRSRALGTVAALLALSSPYLLRYGSEARMYALVAFLAAFGWLTAERAFERPSALRLSLVALSAAALVHTHYWAFWLVGATFLVLALIGWKGDTSARRSAISVGLAVAAGAATFVVWLPVFLDQLSSTGTPWADRARPAEVAIEVMQAIGGNNRFEGELLGVILVVFALLGAFGVARGTIIELRFTRGPLTIAALMTLATLGIGAGVALATAGAFEGRYAAVVVPFLLVLAARGLVVLPAAAMPVAVTVVVFFGFAVGVDEARRDRTQGSDVATVIDRDAQSGDVVAFCPDQVGPATRRALHREIETIAYPRGDGTLVDWSDYADTIAATTPESFVAEVIDRADGNDIWLVTGLGYKSLGNRCETIIAELGRTHQPHQLIAPSTVFEPMLLTRYEPLG